MSVVIQTERLRLRHLRADEHDAAGMLALLNDPGFIRFIADRGVRTIEQARQYIVDGALVSYAEHGYGMFALERLADGAWMGNVGLIKRASLPCTDIGYALLPAYAGKGYAREAAAALLEHARRVYGLTRICAIVDPDNQRSIHLLQQLGLEPQGGIVMPDTTMTLLLLAMDLPG